MPRLILALLACTLLLSFAGADPSESTDDTGDSPDHCVVVAPGYTPPVDVEPDNCEIPDVTNPTPP